MSTLLTSFKYGPRYWTRAWYSVKAGAFRTMRGRPIDLAVDSLRRNQGVIIRNQGALGSYSPEDILRIELGLQRNSLRFNPGRELLLTVEQGVGAEAVSRAFDYLSANLRVLSPDGLPLKVSISNHAEQDQLTDSGLILTESNLLKPSLIKIDTLNDLSLFGLPENKFAVLQTEMDKLGCVLMDKTLPATLPQVPRIEGGYDERMRKDKYSVGDYPPAFDFESYTASKYTPLMKRIIEDAKAHEIPLEIHWGYPQDLEKELSSQGYRVFNFLLRGERFFEAYIAIKDGKYKYAVSIADEGRVLHFQKMLRLSGLSEEQVVRSRHVESTYEQVRELMELFVRETPDAIILGNRGSFRRMVKIHRYAVELLRALEKTYPRILGILQAKHSAAAAELVAWHAKYSELFDLKSSVPKLAVTGSTLARYLEMEKELEEIKGRWTDPDLNGLKTLISIFRGWKERINLRSKGEGRQIADIFWKASLAAPDPEMAARYLDLYSKIMSVLQFEKPELAELFTLDPLELHSHPANLMNLIRFDEIAVALYNEHQVIPELKEMRVFEIDVEVGKKIITPLFKGQLVNYHDNSGRVGKLLLVDLPYGDTAQALVEYLMEAGVKTVLFSGIVGGLQTVKYGQIVAPEEFHLADSSRVEGALNFLSAAPIAATRVKHLLVDTPYDETQAWLEAQREKGMESVDVELSRMARAVAGFGSQVTFGSLNVVSDLIGEKGQDWSKGVKNEKKDLIAARARIMDYFASVLGIAKVSVEIHRHPHVVLDVHQGRVSNFIGEFNIEFTHSRKDKKRRLEMIGRRLNGAGNYNDLQVRIGEMEQKMNCRITILKLYNIQSS